MGQEHAWEMRRVREKRPCLQETEAAAAAAPSVVGKRENREASLVLLLSYSFNVKTQSFCVAQVGLELT